MSTERANTMGQAVDTAIEIHSRAYPGSEICSARVAECETKNACWKVEVVADHYPFYTVYIVSKW